MYAKVIKWISWVLLILGAIIGVYGFIVGFEDNGNAPVDYVLYWAYAMVAVALIAVLLGVVVINTMNDPKNLLRLGIGILAIVVVVGAAYLLAPGTPAVGACVRRDTQADRYYSESNLSLLRRRDPLDHCRRRHHRNTQITGHHG